MLCSEFIHSDNTHFGFLCYIRDQPLIVSFAFPMKPIAVLMLIVMLAMAALAEEVYLVRTRHCSCGNDTELRNAFSA